MPSSYCQANPESAICSINPNYGNFPTVNTPIYTQPPVYQNPSTPVYNPATVITGGGTQINITPLDKILASILSGMAIIKNRPYVPTGIQPETGVSNDTLSLLLARQGNQYAGDGTASGKVETWVKNNTGVVLIGGAVVVAYLMKSPRGR